MQAAARGAAPELLRFEIEARSVRPAADGGPIDPPVVQRKAAMRTDVVHSKHPLSHAKHSDPVPADLDGHAAPVGKALGGSDRHLRHGGTIAPRRETSQGVARKPEPAAGSKEDPIAAAPGLLTAAAPVCFKGGTTTEPETATPPPYATGSQRWRLPGLFRVRRRPCRTIYVGDSGELVTAVHVLGVPHPTGYPLYVLLGKAWTELVRVGSIAFRMSLFSSACAALACALLFLLCRRLGTGVSRR